MEKPTGGGGLGTLPVEGRRAFSGLVLGAMISCLRLGLLKGAGKVDGDDK